jgi:hypothetical protein
VIIRQLQAAEVLSKLSAMNETSSFVKVITKQLKLYFNNSLRIPTQNSYDVIFKERVAPKTCLFRTLYIWT